MRKQYKGCKVKIFVSPTMEERIIHFCDRYNISFSEGCNVLLNANLETWEKDMAFCQGDNARPKLDKPRPGDMKIGPDGRRVMK